jgi:hypothetical protein
MADYNRRRRQEGPTKRPGLLRLRLEAAVAEGALPASTDIDGLSRFYLSVFQRMGHPAVGPRYLGRVLRGFVPAPSRQVRP